MKAVLKLDQPLFDKLWSSGQRFAALEGPNACGYDLEIQTPSYGRHKYMTGVGTDYEDGVMTIEVFTRVE